MWIENPVENSRAAATKHTHDDTDPGQIKRSLVEEENNSNKDTTE